MARPWAIAQTGMCGDSSNTSNPLIAKVEQLAGREAQFEDAGFQSSHSCVTLLDDTHDFRHDKGLCLPIGTLCHVSRRPGRRSRSALLGCVAAGILNGEGCPVPIFYAVNRAGADSRSISTRLRSMPQR